MSLKLKIAFNLLFLIVASLFIYYLFQKLTDELALNFLLKKRLPISDINSFFTNKKYSIIQVLSLPGRIVAEIFSVTALLCVGINLYGGKIANWLKLTNGVLLTQFVFVLKYLSEYLYISLHKNNFSPDSLFQFSSLSLSNFSIFDKFPFFSKYALSTVNLWEILYILLLVIVISKTQDTPTGKAIKIVLVGYGLGLCAWVLLITFLSLTLK